MFASEPKCLRLAATNLPFIRPVADRFINLMNSNDVCIKLTFLPPKRLVKEMQARNFDGILPKVAEYPELEKLDMIPVREPLIRIQGMIVSRDGSLKSMAETHSAGLVVFPGALWQKVASKQHPLIYHVNRHHYGLEMVTRGRAGAALTDSYSWPRLKDAFPDLKARPLREIPFHAFLWNTDQNRQVADNISTIMQEFHNNGQSLLKP